MSLALLLAAQSIFYAMPAPWRDPGFAQILWVQSAHFDRRSEPTSIDTIVLHSTVTPTLEATTRWFMSPESKVSAHYTIGKDGSIVQNVSSFYRAWHAGVSKDHLGREGINHYSVGIELVNLNDGKDPYPEAQVQALQLLIPVLQRRFPGLKTITSHAYIAQPAGRKSDPLGFPWERVEGFGLQIVK